ncbi:contractile injection system protein, VgrG/Pvc8 family [Stenotrophomonas maltophilia]|uniref:phage late control D family protein n=1 Tax=Stenotrophomonas maltophilia TaxID=40324 RepID=UPI00046924ED|nr:contractile injection system protein, VgrG/Pvc8 family [Stenotrophomonas maltophilia]AIL09776.1 phage late control D family protein [Stenotrophomonas maltophilia]QQA83562.1 phage tail protein [Stenotrophomonas maltophilia]WQE24763.1 contractile injection system protein, VgrG/Pvc8 family [Stenotrophomonas maltophilia]SNW06640.1 late control D family protein [Stenotrophomonas maltophilia]HDS1015625.1 phage tail protein [Stenotrophomonas maltophilia]
MGLNITPAFRVVANSQDITNKIMARFKSLRITDETGNTSDTLELQLADHDPSDPIQLPPVGAELEAFIGYDGEVRRVGLYICDEVEISGFPGSMTLRARAAPFETSKGGKSDLQTQKTRTWKKGTTIGDMVRRMAGEHGLKAAVNASLASIVLPLTVQSQESDMNLLLRLAKQHDAIAKPGGGRLVFVKRGESTSASGERIPDVTLTPADGSDYRVTLAAREDAGTTIAYYRDVRSAKRQEVKVGSGEPIMRLRMAYADRESAEAAARAKHREQARQTRTLSYTLPGRETLMAEATVVMQGFREGVDGQWLVKRAEHSIGSEGYVTRIECEQPNSADAVKAASNAPASEGEQVGSEV